MSGCLLSVRPLTISFKICDLFFKKPHEVNIIGPIFTYPSELPHLSSGSFLVCGFKFRLNNCHESENIRYRSSKLLSTFLGIKQSLQSEEYSDDEGWSPSGGQ